MAEAWRKLIMVNRHALPELVAMADVIAIVEKAMRELSAGRVDAPERSVLQINASTRLGLMPGSMPGLDRHGIKLVSLAAEACQFGLPSHQGLMALFDSQTGEPIGALDCHALTRLRTAAASAVATRALARPDAATLAIIGCGDLAGPHVEAICAIRPITRVLAWNRTHSRAEAFAAAHAHVEVADSVERAVAEADIICTLTSSPMPILKGEWLKPGQHVNLVGSSLRAPREADDAVVKRGTFIADSRAHALSQAGELCHAIEQGIVGPDHLKGEIGEVLSGAVPGRTSPSQITIYKSLGHVAQDIAVGNEILRRAANSDKVAVIDW